jgi:hypothetical protein
MLRRVLLLALPMTSALAFAGPALADSTVGQTGTPNPASSLLAGFENVNPSAVVPASGTITSFQTQSATADVCDNVGTGGYDFQVLRPEGSNRYLVLGDTGNQTDPCDGQVHALPVAISVQSGDVLGAYVVHDWAGLLTGGSRQDGAVPEPAVGETVTLPSSGQDAIDLSATFVSLSDTDLALSDVPGDITASATGPDGAVITYTPPTAVDEETATASCSPASGSTFAIGTTTVTCSATDSDDSNSPVEASFTVHVKGAGEQLTDLAAAVSGLGPERGLAHKLARAQFALAAGHTRAACHALKAFSHEVRDEDGDEILPGDAASLIAAAQQIEDVIGCDRHSDRDCDRDRDRE